MAEDPSEYNQQSFKGGMKILDDDTHLDPTQYRVGFNVRNRFDRLDPVLSSVEDRLAPVGIKQEMVTFGNYEILFAAGLAYYKFYTNSYWTLINGFKMSSDAPRFWTQAVPVSTTNYLRLAGTITIGGTPFNDSNSPISLNNVAGASAGNLPGLLVQDNFNQPQFIFLDALGVPTVRTTKNFKEWHITFTDATNIKVAPDGDQREYVPIGNEMELVDGILYITSSNREQIYRSVSGRPLDFMVNVTNTLSDGTTTPPFTQYGGGDASTTAYSVGVGNISCLRSMQDGSLFVGAGNANFSVAKNYGINAIIEFGEYTFIRKFLFNAVCLSDRAILDSTGDTKFITLTGIRSFNAISQSESEGRNSSFSADIKAVFRTDDLNPIIQDAAFAACILFNDYELYAVNTIFGPAIAVFDTINGCWVGFDVNQTGGSRIKMFAKIELTVQILYAITEDDKVYQLYAGPGVDEASFRSVGICSNMLYANQNVKMANPKMEIQPRDTRVILNNIKKDCTCSLQVFINNRQSNVPSDTKVIKFVNPRVINVDKYILDDVNTQLMNLLWSLPNTEQGWKIFCVFKWTGGAITQFAVGMKDLQPMNPLLSQ